MWMDGKKQRELWEDCSPTPTSLHLLTVGLENDDQEKGNEQRKLQI